MLNYRNAIQWHLKSLYINCKLVRTVFDFLLLLVSTRLQCFLVEKNFLSHKFWKWVLTSRRVLYMCFRLNILMIASVNFLESFNSPLNCKLGWSLQVKFHAYRVFSLTWPASMQIYWNKRKRLHEKGIQLPQDWFGTPTWPPFHCFGTPIWPPWRHVKTLYWHNIVQSFRQIVLQRLVKRFHSLFSSRKRFITTDHILPEFS